MMRALPFRENGSQTVITQARANACPGGLPYGAQKKVVIARALMSRPSLLLLDEPASGLSKSEIDELGDLISRLRGRMSIAIVEHHLEFVMGVSDRVTVLDLGRVIASGPPSAIRQDPQVARAYLGAVAATTDGADA